jgi:hypothetical protein
MPNVTDKPREVLWVLYHRAMRMASEFPIARDAAEWALTTVKMADRYSKNNFAVSPETLGAEIQKTYNHFVRALDSRDH